MAKLYFQYSTMNAGKSTVLLQAAHNYRERGMQTYLLTAAFDGRAGTGKIGMNGLRMPRRWLAMTCPVVVPGTAAVPQASSHATPPRA